MRFANWVFLIAGVYGVLLVTPVYFLEEKLGTDYPPAVTHPEFFYGFVGLCLAWQVMYLMIGIDPARYRPIMLLAAAAKLSFVITIATLHHGDRVGANMVAMATPDLVFAVLFIIAWVKTKPVEY